MPPTHNQQGITIWMANVEDAALTTTSHPVTGMTKVYTGAMTPLVGWNEFVFNEGTFSWDGHSNVLIYVQRNNGAWNSTISWQATGSMPFNCTSYRYQDSGAYDPTVANTMYTSTTRPNVIMKGGSRAVANRVKRGNRETATVNPHFVTRSGEMNRSGMTNWRNAFRGSTAYGICVYDDGILDLGINQFDIDDMAAANVINSFSDIGGMVYNSNTGHFYVSSYSNSELYEVDADGTILNTVTTDYAIVSLAWDPTTNTLYSMDGYSWLNITDPATGSMTDIDALSNTDVMCITANASGQLYAVLYGDTGALATIDKTDATVTTVCTLNAGCNYAQSMAFDMNDNKLYWAQCYDDANLYEINPVSGALTLKVANTSEICGLCIPAASSPTPGPTPGPTPTPATEIAYGPVITNAAIEAGTYYLVASSTDMDFEVTINAEGMPCPAVEGFAFGEMPADNETPPTNLMVLYKNIALMHTGRLTDLFKTNNCGINPFITDSTLSSRILSNSESDFSSKLLDIIQNTYKDPSLNVHTFADAMGMSRNLLNERIQQTLGLSIAQFIRTYRLNVAKEMISNGTNEDMNISEIAYEVGFNDPKYFTRCFTKEFNTPPSDIHRKRNDG